MNAIFADTSFFIALLNAADDAHEKAMGILPQITLPIVTTEWILVELGNHLSDPQNRRLFSSMVNEIRESKKFTLLSTHSVPFDEGFFLYCNRPDKAWSMVDCLSLSIMKKRCLKSVLTTDHHFEQAGFNVLLK